MRLKSKGLLGGLLFATAAPMTASGAIIAQYNFGSVSTIAEPLATMEMPTTVSANVSATSLGIGGTTTPATDEGPSLNYYTTPGPNYLSVANTSATLDTGYYVDFVVTAASGYAFTPSSLTIVGGAGGGSNTRSFLAYDSADGLPTSIAATSTTPTAVGGTQIGSGTFTAVRSTGVAMNSFNVTGFTAAAQNLSTLDVRVYFDTQLNGQAKNIDLGSLTLNGAVTAVPEPVAGLFCLVLGPMMLKRRQRGSASTR